MFPILMNNLQILTDNNSDRMSVDSDATFMAYDSRKQFVVNVRRLINIKFSMLSTTWYEAVLILVIKIRYSWNKVFLLIQHTPP